MQILHYRLAIANPLHIGFDCIHIYIFKRSIVCCGILIIAFSLVVHKLQSIIESQFFRFVTDTPKHFIRLIGMKSWTCRNKHQQHPVLTSLCINARYIIRSDRDRRSTKIQRGTQYIIEMFLVLINSFYSASLIGYSHSNHSTIRISHSNYDSGKMRRLNKNTFTVKSLTFLHLQYFFNCIFHILYSSFV